MTISQAGRGSSLKKSVHIGIRNVTFVQNQFHFIINGHPYYMKGANQVPMDYYPDRLQNKQEVMWLLDSASKANFNIIRVWGGGNYMTDFFYDYADSIGIMIWQDMMFSCRFYPYTDDYYVNNSMIEVREQTGRLVHHPSIVFWDLNNEGVMMFNWGGVRNRTAAMDGYNYMYKKRIQLAIADGGVDIKDNYKDTSPSTDSHVYYYSQDCEQDWIYGRFSFLSESGFISESGFLDYDKVTVKEDWGQSTNTLNKRTTLNWRNRQSLKMLAAKHYEIPKDVPGNQTVFGYYLWLT